MHRKVWKWLFGISLTLIVLMILFGVGIWAVGNATGAMLGGIMGSLDPDNFGYRYLPLGDFLLPKVGSPMFYIYLVVIFALLVSIVGLVATQKHKE